MPACTRTGGSGYLLGAPAPLGVAVSVWRTTEDEPASTRICAEAHLPTTHPP